MKDIEKDRTRERQTEMQRERDDTAERVRMMELGCSLALPRRTWAPLPRRLSGKLNIASIVQRAYVHWILIFQNIFFSKRPNEGKAV